MVRNEWWLSAFPRPEKIQDDDSMYEELDHLTAWSRVSPLIMRRTVEGALVMSEITSAAVIFTDPCHSSSFPVLYQSASLAEQHIQMHAVYVWLRREARAWDYLPACVVLRHLERRNGCKTYLSFYESLQHLSRVSVMGQRVFVLIGTAKLLGKSCKTRSESTIRVGAGPISADHFNF